MAYAYQTRPIKKPGTTVVKYYVQSAPQKRVTTKQLAELIEKRSTVSRADIRAVLDALQFEIIYALQNGQSVMLDDIGTFYTRLKSDAAETQKECWESGANLIKHVTCCFRRAQEIGLKLKKENLSFEPSDMEKSKKLAAKQ